MGKQTEVWAFSLSLALLVLLALPALADDERGDKPDERYSKQESEPSWYDPSDRQQQKKPSQQRDSDVASPRRQKRGGSLRGPGNCQQTAQFSVLVPNQQNGENGETPRTLQPRPTLLLHFAEAPEFPVRVTLASFASGETLMDRKLQVERAGVVAVRATTELASGQRYRWYASIYCSDDSLRNPHLTAFMERIEPPAPVRAKLERAGSKRERVHALAEAGVWYDSVATAYRAELEQLFERLLEVAGLEVAKAHPRSACTHFARSAGSSNHGGGVWLLA